MPGNGCLVARNRLAGRLGASARGGRVIGVGDRGLARAATTEATKATTPVIQVAVRRPRQAAIQNFPHRWMTSSAMNSSTLHRCGLLKWPTGFVCHQSVPPSAIANPETMARPSAASVATPNT